MDVLARNTVILFEPAHADEFRMLSKRIGDALPSQILLNDTDQLPHLSLYNTRFPAASVDGAMKALEVLASTIKPFRLKVHAKSLTAGYVFLDAVIDTPLRALHERILDTLNPARDGHFDESELTLPGVTDELRNNLRITGMLFSRVHFKPHVTLAKLVNLTDGPAALDALPDVIDFSADVRAIHFVETGPNGTCKRVIRTLNLGS